jgi:flagellar basal-body rod protein FlgB
MDRLDRFFGVQGAALALRSERLSVIASNIANAATPGYKARDLDFAGALAGAEEGMPMARTDARHLDPGARWGEARLSYRRPVQASLDGNTVELATEQLQFAETALRYRSSLAVLDARISSLKAAMRVE